MNAVEVRLEDVRFYMRNVHTRMPFKYGAAVLTAVPILHVVAQGVLKNGTPVQGVAADILPPKWFDKDPAKSYEDNVADLLWAARAARRRIWMRRGRPSHSLQYGRPVMPRRYPLAMRTA